MNRPPNRIARIEVGSRTNQLTNRLLSMQGMNNSIPAEAAENSHICTPPGASLLDCFCCLVEDAHKADRAGSDAMRRRNHAPPWAQARKSEAGIMDCCQTILASKVSAMPGNSEIIKWLALVRRLNSLNRRGSMS